MLNVYIIGSSALYYWRHSPEAFQVLCKHVDHPLSDCPQSAEELRMMKPPEFLFGPQPIHLMAPTDKQRFERRRYRYTVSSRSFPEEAFCIIQPGLCVASPEMCFLESAKALSQFQVMELCMELCGNYSLLPQAQRGFISHSSTLSSRERIARFLDAASGWAGVSRATAAWGYSENGSRSPMETRQWLLMCLPRRLGGYGIPRPLMNARIELSPEEKIRCQRGYLECDMYWPNEHIVVEYDGHDDHESRKDRSNDAVKRNVLIAKGNMVFTVTGAQICSSKAFDAVVRDIARALGYRLRDFPDDWMLRRDRLRKELLKSMSIQGQAPFF